MNDKHFEQLEDRIKKLEAVVFGIEKQKRSKRKLTLALTPKDLDFSLNARAFVKRFAKNKGGSKRFVLLLAYLAKGEVGKDIRSADITDAWDKMRAKDLLGTFNRFYSSDAKTQGWVDSREYGTYCLTAEWANVL